MGLPRGSKKELEHCHVAYQIDGDGEQKRMLMKFHPRVILVTLR